MTESQVIQVLDNGSSRLGVLGPITISVDGAPVSVAAKLDRSVLVHLILAEGRALSVDLLIEAVWGQRPPKQARNALQVKISRLRNLLGDDGSGLVYTQGAYRLTIGDTQVDARIFTTCVKEAIELMLADEHDAAKVRLVRAMDLWRGEPLSDLDDHPRLVAARLRLTEEWITAQELLAEISLHSSTVLTDAMARLRKVLERDPLRSRARLLLMQALERSGRRAEALAVYDAGRRLLAEQTGLSPDAELQDAFECLLAAERLSSSRSADYQVVQSAPSGSIETARWLASEGEGSAALRLALRGSWWWWFGGSRSSGRDLLEELIGHEATTEAEPQDVLQATAWLAVFEAVEADAERALQSGERALEAASRYGWTRHEALASVLLAERLYQRGVRGRAGLLMGASRAVFAHDQDEWGLAFTDVVGAKATLLAGDVVAAERRAGVLLRAFEEIGEPAGQIMALDLAGYCAEIHGDLHASIRIHRRALELTRRAQAPEWEASQLTRLGSVLALDGRPEAVPTLENAIALAGSIKSGASLALAENGLGLAASLAGDEGNAAEAHGRALAWYQQQQSPAGISYSAGRLSQGLAELDPGLARQLAGESASLAMDTGDPRAVAHGLEAVALTEPDPVASARALGAARALRRLTSAPLPAALNSALLDREQVLHRRLGDQLIDELRRGARDTTHRRLVKQ